MPAFYCDSSALVKRYVAETGSTWLTTSIDPKIGVYVFITRITFVEIVSAVTRKERGKHISTVDAAKAKTQFENDYLNEFLKVEITEDLIIEAARLTAKHAMRAYDAVQLAAASESQAKRAIRGLMPLILLSADTDLNVAATAEGLLIDNPNNHP